MKRNPNLSNLMLGIMLSLMLGLSACDAFNIDNGGAKSTGNEFGVTPEGGATVNLDANVNVAGETSSEEYFLVDSLGIVMLFDATDEDGKHHAVALFSTGEALPGEGTHEIGSYPENEDDALPTFLADYSTYDEEESRYYMATSGTVIMEEVSDTRIAGTYSFIVKDYYRSVYSDSSNSDSTFVGDDSTNCGVFDPIEDLIIGDVEITITGSYDFNPADWDMGDNWDDWPEFNTELFGSQYDLFVFADDSSYWGGGDDSTDWGDDDSTGWGDDDGEDDDSTGWGNGDDSTSVGGFVRPSRDDSTQYDPIGYQNPEIIDGDLVATVSYTSCGGNTFELKYEIVTDDASNQVVRLRIFHNGAEDNTCQLYETKKLTLAIPDAVLAEDNIVLLNPNWYADPIEDAFVLRENGN